PPQTMPIGDEREKTFTEWELTDLNGDGYLDLVFNSTPVQFRLQPAALLPSDQTAWVGETDSSVQLSSAFPSTNQLRVAYNIVGTRFDTTIEPNPFARSVALDSPGPDRGVAQWVGADGGKIQNQEVGFADVNGDGLVDRVVGRQAYLGVFIGTARA